MNRSIDEQLASESFYDNPYPAYVRLRNEAPAHRVEMTGQWLVSRYEDVARLFPDHTTLSNAGFQQNYFDVLRSEIRACTGTLEARGNSANVLTTDPPAHTRLRRALQSTFTPKTVAQMSSMIGAITDELLEGSEDWSGSFDFVEKIAYPLPAIVIADLLGVPKSDRERMQNWSTNLLMFMSRSNPNEELTPETAKQSDDSLRDWQNYLLELIEARRRHPTDDIATALVSYGDHDDHLSTPELLSNFVLFMGAGHETTTSLLSNGLHGLMTHPDQLREIRDDRLLIAAAVEEMLRWENPVQRLRRTAAVDFELHGCEIRRGESVELIPGSANRDPDRFDDPDAFNIHRTDPGHLSLGKGIHFCIGAGLARLEASIVLNRLMDRFPSLHVRESWRPTWRRSSLLRRMETLPVHVDE